MSKKNDHSQSGQSPVEVETPVYSAKQDVTGTESKISACRIET